MELTLARYILTGAPGAGKTAILRMLEVNGHTVVEESATDIIALDMALGHSRPWTDPSFVDRILDLQRQREERVRVPAGHPVFFDRSPVCTLALSRYLEREPSRLLLREVERTVSENV